MHMRDRDESDYLNPKRFNAAYFLRKRDNELTVCPSKKLMAFGYELDHRNIVINWEKYF